MLPKDIAAGLEALFLAFGHFAARLATEAQQGGREMPPVTATDAEALSHYGEPSPAFVAWRILATIERLRAAVDAQPRASPKGKRAKTTVA
jgi:hypothetical protein